ncbi:MAG: hypothetical protein KKG06_00960, partial [Bacteroidetes bacterium]|nr:hypothetical protein [Bacteroidota bacterium]MBU1421749.1 hypothetical protein [Bacteroidota bacterium]
LNETTALGHYNNKRSENRKRNPLQVRRDYIVAENRNNKNNVENYFSAETKLKGQIKWHNKTLST